MAAPFEFRAGLCPVSAYGFKLQLNNLVDHNPTNPQHFIQSLHGQLEIHLSHAAQCFSARAFVVYR